MLVTCISICDWTPMHLEALMLALFNKLRLVRFGVEEPFCVTTAFSEPLVATEDEVWLLESLFFSEVFSLGAGTRSLKKRFYVMNIHAYHT